MKFENDWHEHSAVEKVILAVVLALVTLVVIAWATQGFASIETRNTEYSSDLCQTIGHKSSVTMNNIHSEDERSTT